MENNLGEERVLVIFTTRNNVHDIFVLIRDSLDMRQAKRLTQVEYATMLADLDVEPGDHTAPTPH